MPVAAKLTGGPSTVPFSPDDTENEDAPASVEAALIAPSEAGDSTAPPEIPAPDPFFAASLERIAHAETPVLMALSLAGGAGAATTTAAPIPAPPPSEDKLPVTLSSPTPAADETPQISPSAAANAAPPDAPPTGAASPEPTAAAAPAAVSPPPPASTAPLTDLADLAASLPDLPMPSARPAASPASAPATAGPAASPQATISPPTRESLPALPAGDSQVVATALIQPLPDSEEHREPPFEPDDEERADSLPTSLAGHQPSPVPDPLDLPPAPDELAPQRPDQSGSAFEVPAAAGDLLIAANSQTDFHMDQRRVVFKGNVIMKNERFYLTSDALVAYMKENQSGLEFAEAQGNVIVRLVENGRETGSYGHAKTAVFQPETGEIVLKGWPQLRMGNKAHVASAATTEMSLFTDGRMKTSGRNQTMIVP